MAADDSLVLVGLRTQFYRDSYRKVVMVFLLSLIINIGLAGLFFYKLTHPPRPKYFPTSVNGRILPLKPLDQANQSPEAVLQWSTQAALAAYNYNYKTWRQDLQAASQFFTDRGWNNFQEALRSSRTIDAVVRRKWIVTAAATKAPVILNQAVLRGYKEPRMAWQIKLTMDVQFTGANDFVDRTFDVTMLVIRVSSLNAPRGIGIEQFVVEPVS